MNDEQAKEFEKKLLEKRQGIAANPSRTGLVTDSSLEYGRDEEIVPMLLKQKK